MSTNFTEEHDTEEEIICGLSLRELNIILSFMDCGRQDDPLEPEELALYKELILIRGNLEARP